MNYELRSGLGHGLSGFLEKRLAWGEFNKQCWRCACGRFHKESLSPLGPGASFIRNGLGLGSALFLIFSTISIFFSFFYIIHILFRKVTQNFIAQKYFILQRLLRNEHRNRIDNNAQKSTSGFRIRCRLPIYN